MSSKRTHVIPRADNNAITTTAAVPTLHCAATPHQAFFREKEFLRLPHAEGQCGEAPSFVIADGEKSDEYENERWSRVWRSALQALLSTCKCHMRAAARKRMTASYSNRRRSASICSGTQASSQRVHINTITYGRPHAREGGSRTSAHTQGIK